MEFLESLEFVEMKTDCLQLKGEIRQLEVLVQ